MAKKDTLYNDPERTPAPFAFNQEVVEVFDDMIHRSVPLYDEVQEVITRQILPYTEQAHPIYDLGCSTGTTFLTLLPRCSDSPAEFIGVDLSAPMLKRCATNLETAGLRSRVALIEADINTLELKPCAVVVMNYTLQFLDPTARLKVLQNIRQALQPGGILLMTEKVCHHHAHTQEVLTNLHHAFKRRNGYSDLEISGKREALMNILTPLTLEENQAMLKQAGFSRSEVLLKWYTFASLAAFS